VTDGSRIQRAILAVVLRRLFVLIVLFPLLARADGESDAARARFNEGVKFFDAQQYDKARASFLQAYALKKHPAVLLNLAQSSLRGHHEAEAARWFQQYLRDPNATDSGKAIAERGLADARAKDGRLDVRAPAGVEVFVDDQSAGGGSQLVDVDPGTHAVRAGTASQSVNVASGAIAVVPLGGNAAAPPTTTTTTTPTTTAPATTRPLAEMLGTAGESCRARSDCESNLKCVDLVCVDENAPAKPKTTTAQTPTKSFVLEGVHGFAGISVRAGPGWLMTANGSGTTTDKSLQGTFAFALRVGLFANRNELALEISPFTDLPYNTVFPTFTGPAFSAAITYGYYARLYETPNVGLYWPVRFGAGVLAGAGNTDNRAYLQARMDFIGFALRFSRVMIDLDLPSFRYLFTDAAGQTFHVFAWRAGLNVALMF
jgi:hypothetical protein